MTQDSNPAVVKSVIDYLHSQGHRVLDEHVGYPKKESRLQFAKNIGVSLENWNNLELNDQERLIRSWDMMWVEQAEAFIWLNFGPSSGAGAEFEHRRLLIEMSSSGSSTEIVGEPIDIKSDLFLVICLRSESRSAIIHGVGYEDHVIFEFVDKPEDSLSVIRRYV